jgi:WD40 repeat protein
LTPDGRFLLSGSPFGGEGAVLYDLDQGTSRPLEWADGEATWVALDPTGRIALTADETAGVVRVGAVGGPTAHRIDPALNSYPSISPDGQWIVAVQGRSHTITLWPTPDLSQPPLYTLPYADLLAKLRTLTNLRVVAEPASATRWGLATDPFPGWEEVPTW